jgi:hypothetical protein
MAFTAYKPYSENPLANISPAEMYNNQRILSGTDPEFLTDHGVFFIDTLVIESGKSITISDGKDQVIVTGMISFSSSKNHIRCDYGVKITGDVIMLKGYVIENVVKP